MPAPITTPTPTQPSPNDPADLLLRQDEGAITTLTLNNPARRNALSMPMMTALCAALDDIAATPAIRAVILAANGPAFCAGHDLREMNAITACDGHAALFTLCSRLMMRIVTLPQPVIARVHAMATAAGCQLVASCDLAVAADTARFATPGVNIGLFCSTPMVALSRNVSRKHTMRMLLTGDPIDAATAWQMGLVSDVTTPDNLIAETANLATRITERSAMTIRMGKEAFYRQLEMPLEAAYDYTANVMAENMQRRDAREGIDAFLEKRHPHWHHE